MNTTSCKKILWLYAPEVDDPAVYLPVGRSGQILISEKEYLELKCEVGYWQTMHHKSSIREEILKQTIKEQEGKIRDLRSRVFGKKKREKNPIRMKINQKSQIPNGVVVSNPAVRDMGAQIVPIFP